MKKSQIDTFWQVSFTQIPRSIEPALSHWLFSEGCWGTQENLAFTQQELKYEPKITNKRFIDVVAFFEPSARERVDGPLRNWILGHSPQSHIEWRLEQNQDWLKEWKKHFKSFQLEGINFKPRWKVKKTDNYKNMIVIEPGMAFGTGTHATTQFAVKMLSALSSLNKMNGATVLDVGAGSGILSVVAERLGAVKVLANDNDPECWRECGKMFRLNRAKKIKVTEQQLDKIKGKYDVVIANIIDGILIELKEDLWRVTKSGGFIILSGVLTDGSKAFIKSFLHGQKGRVVQEISDAEWTSYLILK